MKGEMATTHLGLVVYGCVVAAILRSQGVASAPIEGEVANVKANQNGDLEQQLMQQSGENKSSQPSSSSVNHGAAAVDPADPQGQDSSLVDEIDGDGDDVEATGLSSDYYGEVTQLERLNDELREEEEDGIEDIPAAAAAGPAEEEEEEEVRNLNGQLQDEETNNGRNKEGYSINFQERSFENDAKKIENEENKNRAFRIEDDIEQMERPWEDVNDFEGQEVPPSGAAAAENKEIRNDDDDGDGNGRDNESTDQPKEEKEKEKKEEGEGEGERARIDGQNIEQLRYTEDGQRNTAETFDSRLLISREKKTLQGKWPAVEPDKPDMQRDDESRLGYVDDGSFNEEEVYM